MKSVWFHPEAEAEFIAACRFYESQSPGLGLDFIAEARRATGTLVVHPRIGHRFSKRIRRLLLRRFPYALLYRVESKVVTIFAVAHLYRRPGYWRHRS